MRPETGLLQCQCEGKYLVKTYTYSGPPEGEIRFQFSLSCPYWREVWRCSLCGHFLEVHDMDDRGLYTGDYVDSTYGDEEGLRAAFERILLLRADCSDNTGRVQRILEFANEHFPTASFTCRQPSVLDVGSGLCVFLHRMKENNWECTALDADVRQVRHAQHVVDINAVCGDFMNITDLGSFDLVTFNKVLEHVRAPSAMLAKAAQHLNPGGFVYVEVPDGEMAMVEGPAREEFLLGHVHVFSAPSLALLGSHAGFCLRALGRLREPSGKYTLWTFLVPRTSPVLNAEAAAPHV